MEELFGVILILIGIISLVYISTASGSFPEGSELKAISKSFTLVVLFLALFSLWHTVREAFELKEVWGDAAEFPEYLLIFITYLMVYFTAKRLSDIAKKFGVGK